MPDSSPRLRYLRNVQKAWQCQEQQGNVLSEKSGVPGSDVILWYNQAPSNARCNSLGQRQDPLLTSYQAPTELAGSQKKDRSYGENKCQQAEKL